MTEKKLPEVGKRYRVKNSLNVTILVTSIDKIGFIDFLFDDSPKVCTSHISLFRNQFEEIPDNSPKVGDKYRYIGEFESENGVWEIVSISNLDKSIELRNIETGARAGYYFENFPCDHLERLLDNSQPEESKPNAVDEALEELKKSILVNDVHWSNNVSQRLKQLYSLADAAQNLVNALEAERAIVNPTIPQKPVFSIEKHTSKTHQLDENTPAKSIWKPVSELPLAGCDVFIKIGKRFALGFFTKDNNEFYEINTTRTEGSLYSRELYCSIPCNVSEYCTLTDFINEHEALKERVERLERSK